MNRKNNKTDFSQTSTVNKPFADLSKLVKTEALPNQPPTPTGPAKKQYNFVVVFRIEKNGRGGKTVTVMDQLPKEEIFLQNLTKEIKNKCGVGGTYVMTGKEGLIEIQGDKRDQIKKILDEKGIKYKGV